jgi:hypothetical protein
MPLACRQRGVGTPPRRRELYLFAIKIVTILDLPGQIEIVLILLKIEGKAWSAGTKFERPGRRITRQWLTCCTAAGSA